ncbi:hypothetical protein AC578_1624 [Pseudocercospora eumusae]|uniref:Uncharacterized protein n=1 Tax=Pseudocercospora eumusae TaxID=321146 RepID=A0A139HMA8_9PEZI|nr:hypothetical protein AC578_1624 [Pseudocercospora eumusae]
MGNQRQAFLCGHCNKIGTHTKEMCNQNPASRFFGKPLSRIYTHPKKESTVSARDVNASTTKSGARVSTYGTSSTIAAARALPSSMSTTSPAKCFSSDYDEGYAAGYAAGVAAASAVKAPEMKKVERSQAAKAPEYGNPPSSEVELAKCYSRRDLSRRTPQVPRESQAAFVQKWNDFGVAESARMASFKTAESYEKQKEEFAQVLAKEKENPTFMNFNMNFKQTFGTKNNELGGQRIYQPPQPTILPWNPAALPNATNPAANGPPPRCKAVPPHLRAVNRG